MRKLLLHLILLTILFTCLSWEMREPLAPSFKSQVFPLIQAKCNSKECHAERGGSTAYTSYEAIKAKGKKIVKRITNINGIMPPVKSGIKLTKEEITLIKAWVDAGMPDN